MIVGGLLLVLLVVGIGILIVILQDSREHIRAQDAKTAILLDKVRGAEPATREAADQALPLLRQAGPILRQAAPVLGLALPALREARPVLAGVGRAVGPLTRNGNALAAATRDLPSLVRTGHVLAAVALPALEELRDTPRLMRRLLRIQLATLASQRESLRTQLETLAIQRETLTHIRSIDRKTGGTVPAQGAPVAAP
jgi:hypothetical protein